MLYIWHDEIQGVRKGQVHYLPREREIISLERWQCQSQPSPHVKLTPGAGSALTSFLKVYQNLSHSISRPYTRDLECHFQSTFPGSAGILVLCLKVYDSLSPIKNANSLLQQNSLTPHPQIWIPRKCGPNDERDYICASSINSASDSFSYWWYILLFQWNKFLILLHFHLPILAIFHPSSQLRESIF